MHLIKYETNHSFSYSLQVRSINSKGSLFWKKKKKKRKMSEIQLVSRANIFGGKLLIVGKFHRKNYEPRSLLISE